MPKKKVAKEVSPKKVEREEIPFIKKSESGKIERLVKITLKDDRGRPVKTSLTPVNMKGDYWLKGKNKEDYCDFTRRVKLMDFFFPGNTKEEILRAEDSSVSVQFLRDDPDNPEAFIVEDTKVLTFIQLAEITSFDRKVPVAVPVFATTFRE